jgi:hypothetical protein
MGIEPPSPDALRHRLLEGILLRLARHPNADEFVLRGGLLLRHWFQPLVRPAEDLDLVAAFPFDVEITAQRLLSVLGDGSVRDGVAFDTEGMRADGIWLESGNPGVRVFASGTIDAREIDFHIDVTFGPAPRPAAVFSALPTACGESARVWMCRPEAVAGHKVQALWHRGLTGWRPKDLNDLRLLLERIPMDAADLRAAVSAYLVDVGGSGADVRALFGPSSWWGTKMASARWLDFVAAAQGFDVPRELVGVVAGVAARLVPVLEG